MTEQSSSKPSANTDEQNLEFVEQDLKLAMMFARISSTAYSNGNLLHGGDARSKAKAAHDRAVAQLIESISDPQNASLQSMLKEVQSALSSLPASGYLKTWAGRVAS